MDHIRRILVVTRSTENFQNAVHYGIVLAKRHKAKLYVAIAIRNRFGFEGWNMPLPFHAVLEEEYRYVKQEAEKDLDEMIKVEKADNVDIELLVYTGQMVNKEINRILKEKKIDLLIMRTHKTWRFEHFFSATIRKIFPRKCPAHQLRQRDSHTIIVQLRHTAIDELKGSL